MMRPDGTSTGSMVAGTAWVPITLIWLMVPGATLAASFRGLGMLPGGEAGYSAAWDIDAAGSVVVGESTSANGIEAFRWTATAGMEGLGALNPADFFSTALGVSADGRVIVGGSRSSASGERTEPFRWATSSGMIGLGDLPGGDYSGAAPGVSGDGSIVAGTSTSSLSPNIGEAFRWTGSTGLVGLGGLPGGTFETSVPQRVSDNGAVIVGWAFSSNGREAFRWTQPEGMIGLGDLPQGNFDSIASDLSADGSVIVGLALNPGPTSFRWTVETGLVDLGRPPGGNRSAAFGVSSDGSIVVGDAGVSGERVPAIWDELNGMRNLLDVLSDLGVNPEAEGWDLEQATAISADGLTIVGWGFNPEGTQEAWLAHLGQPAVVEIPTVSHGSLLVFGASLAVAALATFRSRQGRRAQARFGDLFCDAGPARGASVSKRPLSNK